MHTLRRQGSLHPDDLAASIRDYVVVDVRGRASWTAGHIAGSIHVPIHDLRAGWTGSDTYLPFAVLAETDPEAEEAVRWLIAQGLDAVEIAGGVLAWRAAGHCLVTNPR